MKCRLIDRLMVVAFLVIPGLSFPQDPVIQEIFSDKYTYDEITDAARIYLDTAAESYRKERLLKHFSRWAYYASLHLGPDGEFVNISERSVQAMNSRPVLPADRSYNGGWYFIGPGSTYLNNPDADILGLGRADRIAFHPTDPNTIYLGTPSGGLWKTTNGGSSWSCLTNALPSIGISGIVVEPANPSTIYILTGDGDTYIENALVNLAGYLRLSAGVFVSHDGGTTWEATGALSGVEYAGYDLVQHPVDEEILFAATSDGIYKTVNSGATWTQVLTGKIFDLEFKPGTPSRMYASGVSSFFYSTDGGDSWVEVTDFSVPLYPNGRVEIAVAPSNTSKVILLAGPRTSQFSWNSFNGLYVSTDSGLSFDFTCNTPNVFGDESGDGDQSEYDIGLAVKPTTSNVIITGGLIIYRSTNGGTTFTAATTYRESGGNYIHPDIHCVAYNPINNYLYAAGDGGFHRSLDDGLTWTDLYSGINTSQFYHLDDYDANANVVLAGCQDNGVKYRNANTTSYSHIQCCDGFDMAVNYSNQSEGFCSVNNVIFYFANFVTVGPEDVIYSQYDFFPRIVLNSSDPDVLYLSFSQIAKYELATGTFTNLGNDLERGNWVIRTCPSNAQRIYGAGGDDWYSDSGTMWVTSDGGTTWTEISGNTGFPATFPRISDIGVNPGTSLVVYACFSGYADGVKVFGSTNGGSTWTNLSYDLPNIPIWSIEVDNAGGIYVGTDNGAYYRPAGASNWEPFYNGLPNVPVSDLAINVSSNQILASTFGRGIWKSTLWETCPVSFYVTSNVSGHYFRTASSFVTMTTDVVGGTGTDVVLRAGDSVNLKPGFQANSDAGSRFTAYIGACESGLPPDYSGQYPVYPSELRDYELTFTRQEGTLELPVTPASGEELVLRLFQDGHVRILLAEGTGRFIRNIEEFDGKADKYSFALETAGLKPGTYYLYLVVNDQVVHLQELEAQ
jgi:photosystem II stability/assembly factor-like uncharacterized protein